MTPENVLATLRARRASNKRFADAVKLTAGCLDCGYSKVPRALHFDHRDPAEKKGTVQHLLRWGKATVVAEIMKCDVRCANCHAEKHWNEGVMQNG